MFSFKFQCYKLLAAGHNDVNLISTTTLTAIQYIYIVFNLEPYQLALQECVYLHHIWLGFIKFICEFTVKIGCVIKINSCIHCEQ